MMKQTEEHEKEKKKNPWRQNKNMSSINGFTL